eukprot:6016962-Lingulodinium_polyedra.AAC.1
MVACQSIHLLVAVQFLHANRAFTVITEVSSTAGPSSGPLPRGGNLPLPAPFPLALRAALRRPRALMLRCCKS